jgi:hypothetical protein
VLFPSLFIGQFLGALDTGVLVPDESMFEERFTQLSRNLGMALRSYPSSVMAKAETTLVTCGRDGDGTSDFRVGLLIFDRSGVKDTVIDDVPDSTSQMFLELGTGARSVRQSLQRWQTGRDNMTSRAAFSAFVESVRSGRDSNSGGSPQLVGIYNRFTGREFGVHVDGTAYLRGMPIAEACPGEIEWRNEYFERCDHTGSRIPGAAVHETRPPKPQ